MGNGKVLRDFYKTHTEAQVTETLLSFTKRQVHILVSVHTYIFSLYCLILSLASQNNTILFQLKQLTILFIIVWFYCKRLFCVYYSKFKIVFIIFHVNVFIIMIVFYLDILTWLFSAL